MSFAGQLVSSPLLAAEEFYLGGPFGRGWYGEEVSGDNGVGGLPAALRPDLQQAMFSRATSSTGMSTGRRRNLHSDGDVLSLSLTGVGVRFYLPADLQAGVELAVPIEYHTPDAQLRDPRAFFYVSKVFKLCPGSAQMHCSWSQDRAPLQFPPSTRRSTE